MMRLRDERAMLDAYFDATLMPPLPRHAALR